jgi:dTDP-glucose pyrophosphorylase
MSLSEKNWRLAVLSSDSKISQAILKLNELPIKIVLIVSNSGELEGTISDGDVRRGLLKGFDINSSVLDIVHRNPIIVPPELGREQVKQLMLLNKIYQIPIVNEQHQIVGLHLWDEVISTPVRPNIMVIMAGGTGSRLRPYTEECPKSMLLIGEKPMLEHIIEKAKLEGFSHFVIAIHYLGHMIKDYFGNGEGLDVRIDYLNEASPLGTAGALSLLEPLPESPFIVTNGDVITDIRYGELLDFHINHSASATMAIRLHEWQHPFGVVQIEGIDIVGFEEKPVARTHINAGVYVLEHTSVKYIDPGRPCDMPRLFEMLQVQGHRTIAYPMHEPWLDVGRPDDLILARNRAT